MSYTKNEKVVTISKRARTSTIFSIYKHELLLLVVLLVLIAVFSVWSNKFFSVGNTLTVLRQMSLIGILAIGETLVILVGGMDLSIGQVTGLAGILVTLFLSKGFGILPAILLTIAFGVTVGLVNGLTITKVGIPDFMVTLATMSIAEGLIFILTGGYSIYKGITPAFKSIGQGSLFSIPYPIIYMFVLFAIWNFILNKTSLGRRIYAVGGNRVAAYLSGINTDNMKILAYLFSGIFSAITGIVVASRLASGQVLAGGPYLFPVITAVVLGGVSLSGGQGSLIGVLIGVLVIGVLNSGMIMVGVGSYWQKVAMGLILVAAITYSSYGRLKASK